MTNEHLKLKPTYLYYIDSARSLTGPQVMVISLPLLKAPMPEQITPALNCPTKLLIDKNEKCYVDLTNLDHCGMHVS